MDKQKILDKVTKLMALANSPGANTNEAAIALRQVSHAGRYNLTTSRPPGTGSRNADVCRRAQNQLRM